MRADRYGWQYVDLDTRITTKWAIESMQASWYLIHQDEEAAAPAFARNLLLLRN